MCVVCTGRKRIRLPVAYSTIVFLFPCVDNSRVCGKEIRIEKCAVDTAAPTNDIWADSSLCCAERVPSTYRARVMSGQFESDAASQCSDLHCCAPRILRHLQGLIGDRILDYAAMPKNF